MQLNWKYTESTGRPLDVDDVSSPTSVFLAKDIVEKQRENVDGEMQTYFEYQCAVLSKTEYNTYLEEQNRSDIDYIAMMSDIDLEEV